ncbi:hypothetical protein [Methanocella conradii]|uniref:hypothetical protein n=1 Tax=Methanocella conradii TaxID=1175444 RepID=UPI00157E0F57|nr:hypothetical protein [Methanocella conradii]
MPATSTDIRQQVKVNLSGLHFLSLAGDFFNMAYKACRRRRRKEGEPLQYVPPEERKTVVESPAREEPSMGKEGGEPQQV